MTKIDVILRAFAMGRISGLTSKPTNEEKQEAFAELEELMALLEGADIMLNYRFDDGLEDIDAETGLERWAIPGIIAMLSKRLMDYYGKIVHPSTEKKARAGLTVIQQRTYSPKDVQRPNRMPRGSGNTNRGQRFYHFYPDTFNPTTDQVVLVSFGDINDYDEDFSAYLNDGETISSFTVEVPESFRLVSSSNTDTKVDYRIEAIVNGALNQQVIIKIQTSEGSETTRYDFYTIRTVSPDNL